jgi:hypothetical protein
MVSPEAATLARVLPGRQERSRPAAVLDRPTTIFETERLAFRRLTMDDLDALAAIFYGRYGFGLWATTSRETNELVGRSGLLPWTIEGRSEIEVAYLLAREHWGRGLGTEAARAVLEYGFEELSLSRLICLIDPANDASHQGGREDRHDPREGTRPGDPTLVYAASRVESI